jgi:hypothetical protein
MEHRATSAEERPQNADPTHIKERAIARLSGYHERSRRAKRSTRAARAAYGASRIAS